ncbi:Lrp/AsnC family transcriptional regulator [Roseinatronobacter sp. S2]|uniref:Lrp/AsnC family transcriptional regulator n=1 Tax=Roseinatronobacter sp. S2 TaxID=3035471 RepID=UPI00240ECE3A|nr:Lrp/AsnC family transcriptional regulator [Roseinatronobacter sp. S2]WFE76983.1 Lrp/AsnC family transcriptional regulator [Roseinatronobacter sp. S2]
MDREILRVLQSDPSLSQRALADRVGMSQNACWRRLQAMRNAGIVDGQTLRLDPVKLGLGLTVFVMIRTRHHSGDWLKLFRRTVTAIPNVIDFYRIAGDYDYMLKVVAEDMNDFDRVYQRLIDRLDLDAVTSYITMEKIADQRDLPL